MVCPTCSSDNPEVASYCYRCGTSLLAGDAKRSTSYAVQSAEGVTQFALISTVMPHTSRRSADNYRWAMLLAGALILGATALGLLPIAIAAAAFLVPLTYLVYIDDVNLWEEAPTAVVVGLFVATGALAVLVSMFFFEWVFDAQWASFAGGTRARGGIGSMSLPALLIFAVLLPVVAEVAKNVFAVLLAARPQFDDMIDGLTFGVAAGTSYAAFETCVVYSSVFTAQEFRTTSGIATWLVVVVNVMVVKSLIYGTATGIAVAAFSGKGEGYDGFTPAYFANFGLAVAANIAYWLGVRVMAYLPYGNVLGLLWGFAILAVLVVKIRMMLQVALLEAAVEAAAVGDGSDDRRSTFVETFCPECENVLLTNASFCIVCGTSVRSSSRQARRAMGMPALPAAVGAAPPGAPALPPADEDARPTDEAVPQTPPPAQRPVKSSEEYFNSSRLKVIGVITAATVAVGALGGLAGVLFDPEPVSKDHVRQPGRLGPPTLGGLGSSAPYRSHLSVPFAARVPTADGTESPGTVGPLSPGEQSTGATTSETSTPAPTRGGDTATIEATGVDVYIPPGWTVSDQNANQVYFTNGDGSYAFAFSGIENPSTTAGDLITSALDDLLPPDVYTQRRTSDVKTLSPFGSVVSIAGIEYEALWVDNQGSITIHGQIYVGVRQDGTVLGIEIEHVPAEEFPDAVEEMYPILDNTYGRFAGLG
ncbi:MAG TPA: hypothetical protein VFI19_02420 [Nocardioides sp.]|nr:hypothetical protein [Nocardioides sp.]